MKKFLSLLLLMSLLVSSFATLASEEPLLDPNDPHTFDIFVDWTWLDFDTFEGGIAQEWMREQTGITLKMTKASDSEQLNLLIASGELPDLIACSASAKVSRLSDPDLTWPLQELIDKYVPEWQVPEVEKRLNAYFSQDGQYYMLKNEFNTAEEIKAATNLGTNFGQFHMRQDIYEALGSPKLENKEDFFALMALVKEKYPAMQPITFSPREYTAFGSMVGYDSGRSLDDNGNLVMYLSDPDYRAMLKLMNELYLAGYITQENFAYNDEEQAFQNFYAGNVFMVSYFAGNDEQRFTAKLQAAVPGAKVVQVPLLDQWAYTIPVSGWAALFITKNCDDPERAIKMLYWAKQKDNSISLTYGVKGIDWDYDEIGNIKILERRQKSADAGTVAQDYKEMGFPLSADNYITIYNAFYAAATPETRLIFDEVVKRATISNAISLAMPKSGSEEQFMYSDLDSLATEYFPRLCMAASPEAFDALYDEMMQIAVENGLNEVNAYLTTTYNDVKELLGAE